MARYHSKACVEGARQGYRTARTELAGVLPPHAIDTVLAAYRKEGARLAATAQAVDLVERALRGEVFTPKMSLPPTGARTAERGTGGDRAGEDGTAEDGRQSAERPERSGAGGGGGREPGEGRREAAEQGRQSEGGAEGSRAEGGQGGETAEQKAGGARRAGARRNSAGRGRSDLART